MISSVVALMVFKVWLSKLGVPGLDILLLFTPFAILFTIFATVGVVNAFNSLMVLMVRQVVSISVATSLSIIAFQVGNFQLAIFLFILLSSAIVGFFVLNPFGKIFLGDGGAYTLGHLACLVFNFAS